MGIQVDNAIIMAAGLSSRFAPLAYETPKALIPVRGEVLIERQIRQLQTAGVKDIYIVTGYKHESFSYLADLPGVRLIHNPEFRERNNHSSIYAARTVLANSYICSADNYFHSNPFTTQPEDSYYAAVYAEGPTDEWCIEAGADGYIDRVEIGGQNSWIMLGHTFWAETFTRTFLEILDKEYDLPETKGRLWEAIYRSHLDELKMCIRPYPEDFIFEFDSLEELRAFDPTYLESSGSRIMQEVSRVLACSEKDIRDIRVDDQGFRFCVGEQVYGYNYQTKEVSKAYEK